MSRILKSLCLVLLVSTMTACAVVPAPYPYYGARVDVVTVRSAPVYRGNPYYGGGYGHHRHHDERW